MNPGTVDPPPTLPADVGCGGESVASRRAGIDSGEGRSPVRTALQKANQHRQFWLWAPPRTGVRQNVMATLIEEADTDLRRSQERFAPY